MVSPRDAEATRARILDAALSHFAQRGLAGGRVDRVAADAGTNVRMIYAYFGNKQGLFDAAVADSVSKLAAAVPPESGDLPGWAGRLFDFHANDPRPLRINLWAQLERPDAPVEALETYLAKTAVVRGRGALTAVDLLTIIYAVAQAWFVTPRGLLESDGSNAADPERMAAHRTAVVEAVTRMIVWDSSPA